MGSCVTGRSRTLSSGLTIIEAVVVVGIVVVMVFFLSPLVNRPASAHHLRCMNNVTRLNIGWVLYSMDHGDELIVNQPYVDTVGRPTNNWVAGIMDWSANPDNTNSDLLIDPSVGALAVYVKDYRVYRCPSDKSVSAAGLRVRSYSMNGFLGDSRSDEWKFPGWKPCLSMSDVRNPQRMIAFVDEHENSIDDGWFINDPRRSNEWLDLPASRHNGRGIFGFADAHAEVKRWSDESTKQRVTPSGTKSSVRITSPETGDDLAWVLERMAQRADRP
jgi:prepilin-type processing-associated H-X9-DG protein